MDKSIIIGFMLKHTDGDKEYYEPPLTNKDQDTIYRILAKYGDDNDSIRGELQVVDVQPIFTEE